MKTYIINMLKDTQKRAYMEKLFSFKSFYECEYQVAIEGKKLTPAQIDGMVDFEALKKRYGNGATLPAVGCSLSHWNVYCDMVEHQCPLAVIFEDDAIINDDSEKYIQKLQEIIFNQDKPIVVLLTPLFAYNIHNPFIEIDGYKVYKVLGGWMAAGYMINNQAAKLLKKNLYPIQYVADDWRIFEKFGIDIYGIVPHITSYKDGKGEIGTSIKENKLTFIDRFKIWRGNTIGFIKGERLSKKKW